MDRKLMRRLLGPTRAQHDQLLAFIEEAREEIAALPTNKRHYSRREITLMRLCTQFVRNKLILDIDDEIRELLGL